MRLSKLTTLLLPTLATAALHPVFNHHIDARHIAVARPAHQPEPPAAAHVTSFPGDALSPRGGVVNAPAEVQPTAGAIAQYPSITTQWVQTVLTNGVTTWVEIIYTQTFADVPDQGALPGSGAVGMGTMHPAQATGGSDDIKAGSGVQVGGVGRGADSAWGLGSFVLGMVGVGMGLVLW